MNRPLSTITFVALSIALVAGCTSKGAYQNNDSDEQDSGAQVSEGDSEGQDNQQAEEIIMAETNYFKISTSLGDMVIRLYDETPEHRDNFKKLVASGFYNDTIFHRIIENFMVQGGDPNSKDDDPTNNGQGGPGYTIPAEIQAGLFHKKGALAAARQPDNVNPERRSSGSQFYIVHGQVFDEQTMQRVQQQLSGVVPGFSYSEEAIEHYTTIGGYPPLDMQYTVFGELVEGFDVLDTIAGIETPRKLGQPAHPALGDAPAEPLKMTVTPVEDYQAGSN